MNHINIIQYVSFKITCIENIFKLKLLGNKYEKY